MDGARDSLGNALAAIDGRQPYLGHATRLHEVLAEVDDLIAELRDVADAHQRVTQNASLNSVSGASSLRICNANTATASVP